MRYALICFGLIGCVEKTESETNSPSSSFTDEDGDGVALGVDCDDTNASVNPSADELCDGIDNNCDGIVDEDATDRLEWFLDIDADGFGDADTRIWACDAPEATDESGQPVAVLDVAGDCDDTDASAYPGATEVCDGTDNDCDGATDEDASDASRFYLDADSDGYGAGTAFMACAAPLGYVDNNDDCDDSERAANPAAREVTCDNIDNDCDGVVDANLVPRDFATLQEAVDGLGDGSEICVNGGTYLENLDLTGRSLHFVGQDGPRSVTLDMSETWPTIYVGPDSDIAFSDIGIRGGTHTVSGDVFYGGFLFVEGGNVELNNFRLTDFSLEVDRAQSVGAFAFVDGGALTLRDGVVEGVSVNLTKVEDENPLGAVAFVYGTLVSTVRGMVDIVDVDVSDFNISSSGALEDCLVAGGLVASLGDSSVHWSGGGVTNSSMALSCSSEAMLVGGAVYSQGADLLLTDFSFTDTVVDAQGGCGATTWGAVSFAGDEYMFGVDGADISGNTFSATSTAPDCTTFTTGAVQAFSSDIEISHFTAFGNTVNAVGDLSSDVMAVGGALSMVGAGSIDHVDFRANDVSSSKRAWGGAALLQTMDSMDLMVSNYIVAGNTATGLDVAGAGIVGASFNASLWFVNGDFVKNIGTGANTSWGGGLALTGESEVAIVNTNFVENSAGYSAASPSVEEGAGIYNALVGTTLSYSNDYMNGDSFLGGPEDVTLGDGNLSLNPGYQSYTGADATAWNLLIGARSELVDMGDPSILDENGTVSDIGAYGGPTGRSW